MSPEWWSAVAAFFAALVAAFSYWQQRRSHIETIRPMIVLDRSALSLEKDQHKAIIHIRRIDNIGNGTACDVKGIALMQGEEYPSKTCFMDSSPMLYLDKGSRADINWKAYYYWEHGIFLPEDKSDVIIHGVIKITYYDTSSNRYETVYEIAANSGESIMLSGDRVQKGFNVLFSRINFESAYVIRMKRKYNYYTHRIKNCISKKKVA